MYGRTIGPHLQLVEYSTSCKKNDVRTADYFGGLLRN